MQAPFFTFMARRPSAVIRLPGGKGFNLRFSAPTQPIVGTQAERVVAINRALEDLIRSCPQQYLWGYNRYKAPRGAAPPPAQG